MHRNAGAARARWGGGPGGPSPCRDRRSVRPTPGEIKSVPGRRRHAIKTSAAYSRAAIPGRPTLIAAGGKLTAGGAPFHHLTAMLAGVTETV